MNDYSEEIVASIIIRSRDYAILYDSEKTVSFFADLCPKMVAERRILQYVLDSTKMQIVDGNKSLAELHNLANTT